MYRENNPIRTLSIRLFTVALLAVPATAIALPTGQPTGGRQAGYHAQCRRRPTDGRGWTAVGMHSVDHRWSRTFEAATSEHRLTSDIVHWKNGGTTIFKFANGGTPAAPCPYRNIGPIAPLQTTSPDRGVAHWELCIRSMRSWQG